MNTSASATPTSQPSFSALKIFNFRGHLFTYMLTMMADNIEHVISYWMIFQKFHLPELGGFAIVSHWVPFIVFSVPVGALADRVDPRRLIQLGNLMFLTCSLGWAYFFFTDSLEMWEAMLLLVLHGCSGVFWSTSSQLLLHDIVEHEQLPSAVRLMATARYLGLLIGPAIGAVLMLTLGPAKGILLNACLYIPSILWFWKAAYGPKFRKATDQIVRPAMRGFGDIFDTIKNIAGQHKITSMILLAGVSSLFLGNSYQPQMPEFAADLGHGEAGFIYSSLLAADACGALIAGIILESRGLLKPSPKSAFILAMLWCLSLMLFALSPYYLLSMALLCAAGFL
jgi:MFS family permease